VTEPVGQFEPAAAEGLQIGEVGLPKLVWGGRRIGQAIGRLHQDEGRARDQAMVLQEPITVASDTKLPFVSVKLTASSRGDRSGSSRARLTIAVSILSGILFQIRRGLGLPSTRASIPPSWYRLYQS